MCNVTAVGAHGVALLSADQFPGQYITSMTSVHAGGGGGPWSGAADLHAGAAGRSAPYRCVAVADRRSQSPPYRDGRVAGGRGSLPSPSADGSVPTPSFGVGPPPISSLYRGASADVTTCTRSCTPLHALKVDTDNGSYSNLFLSASLSLSLSLSRTLSLSSWLLISNRWAKYAAVLLHEARSCDSQRASHSDSSVQSVMLSVHFFGGLPLCRIPTAD